MHPNLFVVLVIALACAPILAALGWVTASRRRDARKARIAERMGAAYEPEAELEPEGAPEPTSRGCERGSHAGRHPDGRCDCWEDTDVFFLRDGVPVATRQELLPSSPPLPLPPRVRVPIAAAAPAPPAQVRQGQPARPAFVPRPPRARHTGQHPRLPVGVTADAARQRWQDERAEGVQRPRHRLDD